MLQTYSAVRVIAVVISPALVHNTPIVRGSLSILDLTRRLKETAGALCLSIVTVVFMTDLLWSEISTSLQLHFSDSQNIILLMAVLGVGIYAVDVQFPISKV